VVHPYGADQSIESSPLPASEHKIAFDSLVRLLSRGDAVMARGFGSLSFLPDRSEGEFSIEMLIIEMICRLFG
jgi:hypothetical protein